MCLRHHAFYSAFSCLNNWTPVLLGHVSLVFTRGANTSTGNYEGELTYCLFLSVVPTKATFDQGAVEVRGFVCVACAYAGLASEKQRLPLNGAERHLSSFFPPVEAVLAKLEP